MNAANSTMFFPTRQQFFTTYCRQYFSLPDSMIYRISKYPKSSEVYQKMIQSCKYFFPKNQILVFHCLQIDDDGWKTCSHQNECKEQNFTEEVNMNNNLPACKIWIQFRLRISSTNPNCASELFPHVYQCDAERLQMSDQRLSFQQFLFCSRNVKFILFGSIMVNFDDRSEVPLEEIVFNLPNLELLSFEYGPESKNISFNTVKNLLRIPHFNNIKHFELLNISEKFDIDTFFNYYENTKTKFYFFLYYNNYLSEDYVYKLRGLTFLCLASRHRHTKRPSMIFYHGQEEEMLNCLGELCKKFPLYNYN